MNMLAEIFSFSQKVCLYVQFSDTTKFFKKAAFNKHPNYGFIPLYLEIRLILRKVMCLRPNSCGLYFILLTSLYCAVLALVLGISVEAECEAHYHSQSNCP